MFEKVAYNLKGFYQKVSDFFHSPKFLKVYDRVMKHLKNIVPKLLMMLVLIVFSYIFMSPILRVFVDSFKAKEDLTNPDIVWIPSKLTFNNYLDAWNGLWMWRIVKSANGVIFSTLINSVVYSSLSAIFQTIVSCMAGYAFARFNFKGKKLWFAGLILAFIIPTQLLTLPRSMMLTGYMNATAIPARLFGLTENTTPYYWANSMLSFISALPALTVTILGQGINSSILIFISFSFFKMIPVALDEAAQIDGANFFQIFYHIILKMSIPTILVVFLFSFIWNWNDTYVIHNLTALGQDQLAFQTLPQSLDGFNYRLSQGGEMSGVNQQNNPGLKSAAILISILPLLILYAFTQRKFVEGIENTGVTGV